MVYYYLLGIFLSQITIIFTWDNSIYCIDKSVLLKKKTLIKFIRNYIRDSIGMFSISSLVKISMISLTSSLSFIFYLNSLVYDRNKTSSGLPRKSSAIFGNCSEMFVWPSEQFWKIFRNLQKVIGNLQKIVKNAVISMSNTI